MAQPWPDGSQPVASNAVIAQLLRSLGWLLPASSLPILPTVQPVVLAQGAVRFAALITGVDLSGVGPPAPAATGIWSVPIAGTVFLVDRVVSNTSTASHQRLFIGGVFQPLGAQATIDLGIEDEVFIANGEATGGAGNTGAVHVWKFSPPLRLVQGMSLAAGVTNVATDNATYVSIHGEMVIGVGPSVTPS